MSERRGPKPITVEVVRSTEAIDLTAYAKRFVDAMRKLPVHPSTENEAA